MQVTSNYHPMHASFSFHHSYLQLAYTTQVCIFNWNLTNASKHMWIHIQIQHSSSWACSPYLCAQILIDPLPLSFLSPYVKIILSDPHKLFRSRKERRQHYDMPWRGTNKHKLEWSKRIIWGAKICLHFKIKWKTPSFLIDWCKGIWIHAVPFFNHPR